MKWKDLLVMSALNLWRRKLRTALTVLGVLIGTASIVVMLSIGIGQKEYLKKAIGNSSELTSIEVYANSSGGGMMMGPAGTTSTNKGVKKLNDEGVKEIAALPGVKYAAPVLEVNVLAKQGVYEGNFSIMGMPQEMIDDQKFNFTEGGWPAKQEGKLPLIMGANVGSMFNNPKAQNQGVNFDEMTGRPKSNVDLFGQDMFLIYDTASYYGAIQGDTSKRMPPKVMMRADGIIATGSMGYSQWDYSAVTEINALKEELGRMFKGKAWPNQPANKSGRSTGEIIYNKIVVKSDKMENTKLLMDAINGLGYRASSAVEYIQQMQQQSNRTQMLLGGIGAISLLVAAIGIANTMMMSIYERTREIGVYKVLGCSLSNIRTLFLLEAAIIGLIGGIVGTVLSYAVSMIINFVSSNSSSVDTGMSMASAITSTGQKLSIIPLWLAASGMLFASLVGMISGIMPALRAMRLSALEAIRTQ